MTTADREASSDGRQRVVDAARACFAESGLAGSTIKAVARRAEVTEGAVYYYFESKQALFEEVVREPMEQVVDALIESTQRSQGATGKQAADELHRRIFAAMLQVVPLYGVAVFSDLPQGKSWYEGVSTPMLEAGAAALERAVPDLRTDIPTDVLFRAMVGMHMGLAIDTLLGEPISRRSALKFDSLIRIRDGGAKGSHDQESP